MEYVYMIFLCHSHQTSSHIQIKGLPESDVCLFGSLQIFHRSLEPLQMLLILLWQEFPLGCYRLHKETSPSVCLESSFFKVT